MINWRLLGFKLRNNEMFFILSLAVLVTLILNWLVDFFFNLKAIVSGENINPFINFLMVVCTVFVGFVTYGNVRVGAQQIEPTLDWEVEKTKKPQMYHLTLIFLDLKSPVFLESIESASLTFVNCDPKVPNIGLIQRKIPSTRFQKETPDKYRVKIAIRPMEQNLTNAKIKFNALNLKIPAITVKLPI